MLSSQKQTSKEDQGCVEGVLVEIERYEREERKTLEVCLADDKGEELDLIVWEEIIKEEEEAQEFRIVTDGTTKCMRDKAVQTGDEGDAEAARRVIKEFPNLKTGGGLLPDPPIAKPGKMTIEPLEWTIVVYPCNQCWGGKVICSSPCFNLPPREVDWVRHPCCGMVYVVRSTPLGAMTDQERFGPAPM